MSEQRDVLTESGNLSQDEALTTCHAKSLHYHRAPEPERESSLGSLKDGNVWSFA